MLRETRRLLAIARGPALAGSVDVPFDSFDYVCEVDTPLPEYLTAVDPDTEPTCGWQSVLERT